MWSDSIATETEISATSSATVACFIGINRIPGINRDETTADFQKELAVTGRPGCMLRIGPNLGKKISRRRKLFTP